MRTIDVVRHEINQLNELLSNPELERWAVLKARNELDVLIEEAGEVRASGFDTGADTFHIYREGVEAELNAEPVQTNVTIDPDIISF